MPVALGSIIAGRVGSRMSLVDDLDAAYSPEGRYCVVPVFYAEADTGSGYGGIWPMARNRNRGNGTVTDDVDLFLGDTSQLRRRSEYSLMRFGLQVYDRVRGARCQNWNIFSFRNYSDGNSDTPGSNIRIRRHTSVGRYLLDQGGEGLFPVSTTGEGRITYETQPQPE